MFDGIGFMELLLIAVLGLVVLGPERLPVAVRSVLSWVRAIRKMANSVKDELAEELKIDQLHNDLKKAENTGLKELSPELQESVDQLKDAAKAVTRPYELDPTPKAKAKSADNSIHAPAHDKATVELDADKTSSQAISPTAIESEMSIHKMSAQAPDSHTQDLEQETLPSAQQKSELLDVDDIEVDVVKDNVIGSHIVDNNSVENNNSSHELNAKSEDPVSSSVTSGSSEIHKNR